MKLNKYFDYAKSLGFSNVEFKINSTKELSIKVFHKKVEKYSISENETVTIRGIINGNMVGGYTENVNNICAILDEMANNGKIIEDIKEQEIFAGSKKYKRFNPKSDLDKYSVQDKINLCLEAEKKAFAYDSRISEVDEVDYDETQTSRIIANSTGLKLSSKKSYGSLVLSLVASENQDTRTGFHYQFGLNFSDFDVDKLVKKAADDALNALNGITCASGKYKTMLSPNVFNGLLRAFMSSVSGESVNKGASLLKDKLNTQIASRKINIIEDPNCKNQPVFYRAFDDEGVATSKKTIVDKGVLKTFLYNLEQSKIAKCESTGNGYGGSNIGISTAFLYVKPGKLSQEELAKKINKGIYITSVQGLHSGMNQISGDFSLQACGYMIEDGKIAKPVNLITIAGNLFKMLQDVCDVGSDLTVDYGGYGSPSVVIKKMSISGK